MKPVISGYFIYVLSNDNKLKALRDFFLLFLSYEVQSYWQIQLIFLTVINQFALFIKNWVDALHLNEVKWEFHGYLNKLCQFEFWN